MKELDFVTMGQTGSEKVATALEISGAERSTHKHGDVTVVAYMHHDDTVAALEGEVARLRGALGWYADKLEDCNRHGAEGDAARDALAKDTGDRARAALNFTGDER